jgi:hypothetical protein
MTSFAPASTSFAYIESDIPGDQTLVEWRREREAQRRRARRRLWPARWAT